MEALAWAISGICFMVVGIILHISGDNGMECTIVGLLCFVLAKMSDRKGRGDE